MLNLYFLLLTTGILQCSRMLFYDRPQFQLNADGYIECYEDLDCPNTIEIPEDSIFLEFSCSGKAHFEPTAQDIRVYNSTGTYKVCKQTVRSNCCQESKKLVEECEEERKSGCKEIFDGNKPLQALSSISGLSTLFPRRCPGCPFSCPHTNFFENLEILKFFENLEIFWKFWRCPGCPFSCPHTTPCRVRQKDQHGVRCCKLIGLGRANRVLACPFRCFWY